MDRKYKLTISLLASNRKDTLPKCLASLKPLLDNVSSELIVVDTGCDDDLMEVISQYTDNIEKFTWCKDFAKARNVGVSKAQGQWFMFIDDDEWFEDVHEFIDFFNSEEEKKYNHGRYIVRNYENRDGTRWTDAVVGRIFRLQDNSRFEGVVHEYMIPSKGPTKPFTSFAHHYGYVYDSEEERLAHSRRNQELLMEQIEREPDSPRHYAHLYQEFNMLGEYDESMKYTLKALENVDEENSKNFREMNSTYANYVFVLMHQKKYKEVIEAGDRFIQEKKMSPMAQATIFGFISVAYVILEKYQESMEYTDKFYKVKKYYDNHIEQSYEDAVAIVNHVFVKENVHRIISAGLKAATELGYVEKAYEYIEIFDWSEAVYMLDSLCIGKVADLAKQCKDLSRNVRIFGKISRQTYYFNILMKRIMEIKQEDYEHYLELCNIMSNIAGQSGYIQLMKIIAEDRKGDIRKLSELYENAIASITDILAIDEEFFEIAMRRKIDIKGMILKKPVNKWISGVDQWIKDIKIKELIAKKNYMDKLLSADSLQMKYLEIKVMEFLLVRRKVENLDLNTLMKELHNLAMAETEYYKNIYTEQVFDNWSSLLPLGAQMGLKLLEIEKLLDENNEEEAIRCIKGLLELCPFLEKILVRYEELIKEKI